MNLEAEKRGSGVWRWDEEGAAPRLVLDNLAHAAPVQGPVRLNPGGPARGLSPVRMRLFIAGSTPSSVRAERHLSAALARFDQEDGAFALEIIDVFTEASRALADSVIVTPTLIADGDAGPVRLIGDLADEALLMEFLEALKTRGE